jgi:hypothetical protein
LDIETQGAVSAWSALIVTGEALPTYTKHARDAMKLRGVSEADVEHVLLHPTSPPQAGNRPDTLVIPGFDLRARRLRIVVDVADMSRVVTVLT